MTDIVKELRQASLNRSDYRWEAADEIERLRSALEDIAYGNPLHNEDDLLAIARTALEGK